MTFGLTPSVFIHCMTFYIYIYKGKYMTLDISLSMSVFGISMLSVQSRSVLGHLAS